MATLLRKQAVVRERVLRQLSSDVGTVEQTTVWEVEAVTDAGQTVEVEFDHDPTSQEILDKIPALTTLVPTKKADLETYMVSLYETWQRWKTSRIEAQARAMAAPVITAVQAREDAAWTAYAAAVNSWRLAV